jgi:two-component system, chemotaxis family, response regulator Rcp1
VAPTARRVEILLVEDSPADATLLTECLRQVRFPYHLSLVTDGAAALAFLIQQAPYTKAPTPDLLLLDIRLPHKSGWEILAWVRATPFLTGLPVVILTGLFSPYDEEQIEHLQPTRCLLKPRTLEDISRVAQVIETVISQHLPLG